ncbi:MAG: phenylalanyl-tRNA synthetase beta chain [Phycisphaerales bacterium]|jgi:phenylalanyl-tRNA synthetase beta chain
MDISLNWINRYLEPSGLTADQADHTLTEAGFPLEGRTVLPSGDTLLDVEVTSNRGDCLSHVGCAREIAGAGIADPKRRLVLPEVNATTPGAPVADSLKLENRVHEGCPLFTAMVIRNVKIGPSPAWLVEALESVGSRSINNVVDVTNFITLELGNPCHVFDLAKLAGGTLIVRRAEKGERIKTLYEGEHELKTTDLVVADAARPQSLAGIIGGHDSQVDEGTTDVVFEMATWDPVTIRTTGRRLNIRTDAAYRFERGIDPRTIGYAAQRAVQLICELAGGEPASGVLSEGADLPTDTTIALRPSRCAQVLGIQTPAAQIAKLLTPLGIGCEVASEDEVRCTVPPHRSGDLTREIDLVEEVARTRTLAAVPLMDKIPVSAPHPSQTERAVTQIASVLTGQGFYETVTFSFTSPERAAMFCPKGVQTVAVDDERRKADPTLRPSVLPSLLHCRRANQDGRVHVPGGVRLFELAAVFGQEPGQGRISTERRVLAMVMDAPSLAGDTPKRKPEDVQHGLRVLRGAADRVVQACFGGDVTTRVEPAKPEAPGWAAGVFGRLIVATDTGDLDLGSFGQVSTKAMDEFGIDLPVLAAELDLKRLTDAYPPKARAHTLPRFPGVDRDVSLIVDESTAWANVDKIVHKAALDRFVGHSLVAVFRGKQVGEGKKSVTVRLSFRDPDRTLRHEEVDPQVERFTAMAQESLGAQIRG